MLQCTAVTAVRTPHGGFGHPMCELGEEHEGEHAEFCWDDDATGGAVWFRWSALGGRFVLLPACEVTGGAYGDACTLFRNHPAAHAWNVVDPTLEAVRQELERQFPELLREPGPGRPGPGPEREPGPEWG
ncbi:hypothetical protein RND61_16570 [Streptomyces sp. TRM76323]|uniref:Uncharacterized protein n=1 Tax=Streptomyces tamarix TaxID=3078565 RepID=A0ABU3QLM5_9ACTN|nr:hypothetical protein [Streptomyces tamarix]MDT9683665.1 hypothetical protein [Streptomyces tamarix]